MDPLPPDPYQALGLTRNADQSAIKSAYRKLALKYHPDKAKDKAEDFHKVQSAYELIGEQEAREKFDAEYRLAQLRSESQQRAQWYQPQGPTPRQQPPFDPRTPGATPSFAQYATSFRTPPTAQSYSYSRSTSYEPADYFNQRSPNSRSPYDYDIPSTRRSSATHSTKSPRDDDKRPELKKEKSSSATKAARSEAKKHRDKGVRSERRSKNESVIDLGSDEEGPYTRRTYPDVTRDYNRDPRRSEEELPERRRTYEETRKSADVRDYISRSRDVPIIEKNTATAAYASYTDSRRSSRDEPIPSVESPSSRARQEPQRKSSSRLEKEPSEPLRTSRPSISRRSTSRRSPSVEAEPPRRKPSMPTATSSPANLRSTSPELHPRRTRTTEDYRSEDRPTSFRRSGTAPIQTSNLPSGGRRDNTTPINPSNLRSVETQIPNNDSGYSTGNSPDDAPGRLKETKPFRHVSDDRKVFIDDEDRYARSPSPDSGHEKASHGRDRSRERERSTPTRDRGVEKESRSDRERTPVASAKDRDRALKHHPPVSRSASFTPRKEVERERRPSVSRRGSVSRADSYRGESSSGATERPALHRSTSTRGESSRKTPTLDRGATMPAMRTGSGTAHRDVNPAPTLYGEIPRDSYEYDLEDQRVRRESPVDDRDRERERVKSSSSSSKAARTYAPTSLEFDEDGRYYVSKKSYEEHSSRRAKDYITTKSPKVQRV